MKNTVARDSEKHTNNPLPLIEHFLQGMDIPYQLDSWSLSSWVRNETSQFTLMFDWDVDQEHLRVSCSYDLVVPKAKRNSIRELENLINADLEMGHFCMDCEGRVQFCYTLSLKDTVGITAPQLAEVINTPILECKGFHEAFNWVLWGGMSPSEAYRCGIFVTPDIMN